jgi:hypothetical protein
MCNRCGPTGSKRAFVTPRRDEMPMFYNNVYKTPYNGTKLGLIGKISFQTKNRKIYPTIFCIRYGSTSTERTFCVHKMVKMPILYNNVYKTPYNGTKYGLIGKI